MSHPTKYTLLVRKQIEVNTDPQRRCYNGCHASSELVWTDWEEVCNPPDRESGEDTIKLFKSINPSREYRLDPPTLNAQE